MENKTALVINHKNQKEKLKKGESDEITALDESHEPINGTEPKT